MQSLAALICRRDRDASSVVALLQCAKSRGVDFTQNPPLENPEEWNGTSVQHHVALIAHCRQNNLPVEAAYFERELHRFVAWAQTQSNDDLSAQLGSLFWMFNVGTHESK